MDTQIRAAWIGAVSTFVAGVLGAAATIAVALFHIGAKDDARPTDQRGVFGTVEAGRQILTKLANPAVPLDQVLPQKTVFAPAQRPIAATPPAAVPNASLTSDPFITDLNVLSACIGVQPLKVQRLRVDPDAKGYGITVELTNGASEQISVWEDGNPTLKNEAGDVLPPGRTNVPMTNYYTFVSEDQAALGRAFNDGLSAQSGDVVPMHFTFEQRDSLHTAATISFEGNFRYVLKDTDGKYTALKRTLSCSGVPVKRLAGS